jgi:hypothetical protein
MENKDFIKVYTSNSIMEKSVIEEEFYNNKIDFYCSEDLAVLLGHSTFHFFIRKEDTNKVIKIFNTLKENGELSNEFDPSKIFGK